MNGWSSFTRQATALCMVLAIALAVLLMAVKFQVQRLERELSRLQRQTIAERQAVHVLTAEFSYLIDPDRLRRLATQHLGLVPVKPEQLGSFAVLDEPLPEDGRALVAGRRQQPAAGVRPAVVAGRGR